ncbi:MAG: hypothetical protein ACLUFA_01310 [[Clostridium] leptum]
MDYAYNGIKVRGFISKPRRRANRSMQHFFINGRFVKANRHGCLRTGL